MGFNSYFYYFYLFLISKLILLKNYLKHQENTNICFVLNHHEISLETIGLRQYVNQMEPDSWHSKLPLDRKKISRC
jgi:hypothetical protein